MIFAELDAATAVAGGIVTVVSALGGFMAAITLYRNGEASRYQAICDKALSMHARCEDHLAVLYRNQRTLHDVCAKQNDSLRRIGGQPVPIPEMEEPKPEAADSRQKPPSDKKP